METKETMQHIEVLIAGRKYPLKIHVGENGNVQRVVALINDKLNEFATHYSGKDRQDYLAMLVLMLATENEALKSGSIQHKNDESEQLSELNHLLEAVLS